MTPCGQPSDDYGGRTPLCNWAARAAGEDPIGTAARWDQALAVALPLRAWDAFRDPARWSARRQAVQAHLGAWVQARGVGFGLYLYDDGSGRDLRTGTRVRHYARQDGAVAQQTHHLNEDALLDLMERALRGDERPTPDPGAPTEWLVCTHGHVDAACGRHGYPLYAALRERGARVWRSAHLGGHRFAPTVTELPSGRAWAFMDEDLAAALHDRQGDHTRLRGHYRGWGALEPIAQVAEREAFMRAGWWWLDADVQVQVTARDDEGSEVLLCATDPSGTVHQYRAWVRRAAPLEVRPRSDSPLTQAVAQYTCTLEGR